MGGCAIRAGDVSGGMSGTRAADCRVIGAAALRHRTSSFGISTANQSSQSIVFQKTPRVFVTGPAMLRCGWVPRKRRRQLAARLRSTRTRFLTVSFAYKGNAGGSRQATTIPLLFRSLFRVQSWRRGSGHATSPSAAPEPPSSPPSNWAASATAWRSARSIAT